jgi:hypothetical protein
MKESEYLVRYNLTDGNPITEHFTDWLAALDRYTERQDKFFEPELFIVFELKIPTVRSFTVKANL